MELTSLFVIYLILFRMAIIAAGTISIYLGYRLFCRETWPENNLNSGAEVDARMANYRFTIRNAAPGTCFSLFGVAIIGIMFVQGSPELTLKGINNFLASEQAIPEMRLRGDIGVDLRDITQKGLKFEQQKQIENAISAYEKALLLVAAPMNNLAWLYQKQDRFEDALPISRLAVQLSPNNPNHLDTLGEILAKIGKEKEAIEVIKKAAKLNPEYTEKLNNLIKQYDR